MSLARKSHFDQDGGSYYDVLEVAPDASIQEIREAYVRLKSAYGKDSVALYSLIDHEETDALIDRIEDAYHVLSDSDRRKKYDESFGKIGSTDTMAEVHSFPNPRESSKAGSDDSADPLSAPATDFQSDVEASHQPQESSEIVHTEANSPAISIPTPKKSQETSPQAKPEVLIDIQGESDWHGSALKRIRESMEISMEEMSEYTKITKRYLRAIEDEDFEKLPAAVYLRGFVVQIAKKLRLPHDDVAKAYVQRYRDAKPEA